jgi:hypothetical protein
VIGVNSNDEIYQYRQGTWFRFDGILKNIAISVDGINTSEAYSENADQSLELYSQVPRCEK